MTLSVTSQESGEGVRGRTKKRNAWHLSVQCKP